MSFALPAPSFFCCHYRGLSGAGAPLNQFRFFAAVLGDFGGSSEPFGVGLERSEVDVGRSGAVLSCFGRSWNGFGLVLETSWAILERSWAILGHPGAILGRSGVV